MKNPQDLKYSKEHEWVRMVSDTEAVIGVTAFATESLGDVVFLNLPDVGAEIKQFARAGEVESVKAVSDIFAPVSGKVIERNEDAIQNPEKVNQDPFGQGWLVKLTVKDRSELSKLMSAKEYDEFTSSK